VKTFEEYLSPIKLNLFLEVINKTSDGYHQLESLMIFCKFGDFIKIKKSNKFLFSVEGPFSENLSTRQNIIIDTVSLLENFFGMKFNIEIVLKKNLPISSGMGGGSSNAASILKFLYKYHQIKSNNFKKDAPLIGSDVLLFIDKYPKIIDGLNKFNYSKAKMNSWKKIFIILPLKKNLTKNIYNHFKNYNTQINSKHNSQNNLTRSSMILNQEFKEIFMYLSSFRRDFLKFGMSGSGSSIFLSFKQLIALATAKYVFPVPAGPVQKTTSLSFKQDK